jgi:hypothetical protein
LAAARPDAVEQYPPIEPVSAGAPAASPDEIDLGDVWRRVRRRRWLVLGIMGACLTLAILYLNVATFRYTATQVVTPTDADTAVATSRLGSLSDLAKLGGINLPSSNNVFPFMLYTESLRSRSAAQLLAADEIIMRRVFAREWNAATGQYEEPQSLTRSLARGLQGFLGIPRTPWQPPDAARLHEYMLRELEVIEDPKKPFVTARLDHVDPEFAVLFLNRLHQAVDRKLRANALARTEESIRYLSEELNRVTLAEHREALAAALSQQEKARMAASRSTPYAAEVFVSATPSRTPTSPNVLLVLLMGLFGGLAIGVAVALFARP